MNPLDLFNNLLASGAYDWLRKLTPQQLIVFFSVIFCVILVWKPIKKWFKKTFHKKRSCVDCLLIVFGISEQYRTAEDSINRSLLGRKMSGVEQKIELINLELLKKYKEYQAKIVNEKTDNSYSNMVKEYWGYKHALRDALDLLKKYIKRTIIENGFHKLSEKEFSMYVKEKVNELISVYEQFIMNDYPRDCIVPVNYLFDMFDRDWFEDIAFSFYMNAKEIQLDAEKQIKELEEGLKHDMNGFIKGAVTDKTQSETFLPQSNQTKIIKMNNELRDTEN